MLNDTPQRFRHTELLIGSAGLSKLNCEKVAVIGLGGLGSFAVEALARAGVGWLILVDFDLIRPEDTNRELQALEGCYGQPKATALAERVKAINPEIAVVTWQEYLRPENLATILHGRISYVVDTINSVPAKVALIRYCREREIPVISAGDTGTRLDPAQLRIADLGEVKSVESIQPLCASLREQKIDSGVKLLYSTETPLPIQLESPGYQGGCGGCGSCCGSGCSREFTRGCPNQSSAGQHCCQRRPDSGTLSYLPGIAGLMLAGRVLRDLLSK